MSGPDLAQQMRELELAGMTPEQVQRLRLQLDEARLEVQKEHLRRVEANGTKLDAVAKGLQLLVYVTAAHVGLGLGLDVGASAVQDVATGGAGAAAALLGARMLQR